MRYEAIVNPANAQLRMGGAITEANLRKGGQVIQDERDRIAPIRIGEAVTTNGGRLRARWVIHAMWPRFREEDEDR